MPTPSQIERIEREFGRERRNKRSGRRRKRERANRKNKLNRNKWRRETGGKSRRTDGTRE